MATPGSRRCWGRGVSGCVCRSLWPRTWSAPGDPQGPLSGLHTWLSGLSTRQGGSALRPRVDLRKGEALSLGPAGWWHPQGPPHRGSPGRSWTPDTHADGCLAQSGCDACAGTLPATQDQRRGHCSRPHVFKGNSSVFSLSRGDTISSFFFQTIKEINRTLVSNAVVTETQI